MKTTTLLGIVLSLAACTAPQTAPEIAQAPTPLAFVAEGNALRARMESVGLTASVREGVVHVSSTRAALSIETATVGCAEMPAGTSDPSASGERVEIARGGATEWLVSSDAGLEQGFTFASRPRCPAGELSIDVRIGGSLTPSLASDTRVVFADASGVAQLSYGALAVRDADGAAIPAHFTLSSDRVRIVVDDHSARYPLVVDPLITNEQQRLTATGGAAGDGLGFSVAVSNDTMVVGAPQDGSTTPGHAYVFVRSGTTWAQQAQLTGTAASGDFGYAVAIDGDTIVVGAPYAASFDGAAYVYVRSGTTWTLQATLALMPGDRNVFGSGVAIHGDTAIIGAPGSGADVGTARVYARAGTTWTQSATIFPQTNSNPGMKFGTAVAYDGTVIVIGAPFSNEGGTIVGTAYAYGANPCFASSWDEEAHFVVPDGSIHYEVGNSVAVSNGTAILGAPQPLAIMDGLGAAYVYTRTDPGGAGTCPPTGTFTWALQQELHASDGVINDAFGSGVAINGDRLVVGAQGASSFGGAGYYFTRTGTTWTERTKLVATDTGTLATGASAAIGDTFSALGAPGASTRRGAAYVFDTSRAPNGGTCSATTDCASGFCVDGFCCNTACGGGDPNDCQACSVAAGATTNGTCHAAASGSACSDGSMCTTGDTCNASGTCGGTALTCTPTDQCHTAACDPTTGACAQTALPNGTTCNDGSACTTGESCQAGACTGGTPVVCTASNACHVAGTCDPATGCTTPAAPDGTTCADGNACTQTDTCVAGTCVGANPVVCGAPTACHSPGACDPTSGICTNPTLGNGVTCNDGDDCTVGDVCMAGACTSGAAMTCPANVCQAAGTCAAGVCSSATPLADGTVCPMGMCAAGSCVFPDGGMMPDAGHDGGTDAGNDAGNDAGSDAGIDAGSDAGIDAGTDAAVAVDASTTHDAGTHDAGHDAGARSDATIDASPDGGSTPPPSSSCGCAVPSRSGRGGSAWIAIGLALFVIKRRVARASR